jgi:hypothetical protein
MPKWTKIEDDYLHMICRANPTYSAQKTISLIRKDTKTLSNPEFWIFKKREDDSIKERIYKVMGRKKRRNLEQKSKMETYEEAKKDIEQEEEEEEEEKCEKDEMKCTNVDQGWQELEEHLETEEKFQQKTHEMLPIVSREDKGTQTDDPVNPHIMFVFGKWKPRIYMNFFDFLDIAFNPEMDFEDKNLCDKTITDAKFRSRNLLLQTAPDKNKPRELSPDELQYHLIVKFVYGILSNKTHAVKYMELLKYRHVLHGGVNTDTEMMNKHLYESYEYIPDKQFFVSLESIQDARKASIKMNKNLNK